MKKNEKSTYLTPWYKGGKWGAILLYIGFFVYGVINLLEGVDSPNFPLFHLLAGGISIFIFFMISFFYIGSITKKWGVGWKNLWVAMLSSLALIGAVCLIFHALLLTLSLTHLWLVFFVIIVAIILPILLLIVLFSFLYCRQK